MIELKNICKKYKSKKGNDTIALNNLSLTLDNKGMVFILGKSGSGKSTLLNLTGGLDKYDSGEIIILGKSSKDFEQSDFDSYRNTYIGFIFQEFNLLEDYNVYENVTLALKLQQKEINKTEIENLFEKLEIKELKQRKVNELSGGQKQRVAIARALIKNPKIILADEPTGNLDSTTGKEVMNLLKEISKEKLVVIVSHDNEMANTYADRIIEIKDGEIIKDLNKIEVKTMEQKEYKTIKSRLPLKESFKLGLGSLKHKKLKLICTIFLTVCTLLFLSLTDTLSSYNVEKAHAKLLKENNEEFVQIEKFKYYDFNNQDAFNRDQINLTKKDSNLIKEKVNSNIYEIYKLKNQFGYLNLYDTLKINFVYNYNDSYERQIYSLDIVVTDSLENITKEKIIGRTPQSNNEIVISSYVADMIIANGIESYDKEINEFVEESIYKPKSYEELINSNKRFYFGNKGKVKIVGIINYNLKKYEILKNKEANKLNKEESLIYNELSNKIENIYNKIYVNSDFLENLEVESIDYFDFSNLYKIEISGYNENKFGNTINPSFLTAEIEYFNGEIFENTNKLNKGEMILNVKAIEEFDYNKYYKNLKKYIEKNPNEQKEKLEKEFFENYISEFNIIGKDITLNVYVGRKYDIDNPTKKYQNIKIVGLTGYELESKDYFNYYSLEDFKDYRVTPINKTGYLVPIKEENSFVNIFKEFKISDELSATSTYTNEVISLVNLINLFKTIGRYASIILIIFSTFLISNFIVTSIIYRKKEIGTLRSLGARSIDVIKIFLWEGIVMAFISSIITSILLIVVSSILNNIIMSETSLILTPFIIGIRQFMVIFLLVFIVVIISSVIPIRKISKMKPIDAILKK